MELDRTGLINTPLQRGEQRSRGDGNRFNGFVSVVETVETVPKSLTSCCKPLKRGV
jgi:hypothetical protein